EAGDHVAAAVCVDRERFAGNGDRVTSMRVIAGGERWKRKDRSRDRVRNQAHGLHAKQRRSEFPGQSARRVLERDPEDRRQQREVVAALDAWIALDAEEECSEQKKGDGDGIRKGHAEGASE